MIWILQHQDIVPAGRYDALLEAGNVPKHTCLLHHGDPLPEPRPGDGVLILGGTMGAYETERYAWLGLLKTWLARQAEKDLPMLGICLGAQLLADALGGTVSARRYGERGVCRVDLADAVSDDALFAGVPPTFCALQWHNDSFDLPPGATRLAGSRDCPVQAFRYRNAWAVQFHPEVDAGVVAEWNRRLKEPGDYVSAFEAARTDWQPVWDGLLSNFLAVCEKK